MTAVEEDVAATQDGPLLIVDDMAEVRGLLTELLEDAGVATIAAANGLEACRLLAAGAAPSIILLDVRMPVMDGWEFLRTAHPSAPVILMSGLAVDLATRLPPCVVGMLEKPLSADLLFDALRIARERRSARPQAAYTAGRPSGPWMVPAPDER